MIHLNGWAACGKSTPARGRCRRLYRSMALFITGGPFRTVLLPHGSDHDRIRLYLELQEICIAHLRQRVRQRRNRWRPDLGVIRPGTWQAHFGPLRGKFNRADPAPGSGSHNRSGGRDQRSAQVASSAGLCSSSACRSALRRSGRCDGLLAAYLIETHGMPWWYIVDTAAYQAAALTSL